MLVEASPVSSGGRGKGGFSPWAFMGWALLGLYTCCVVLLTNSGEIHVQKKISGEIQNFNNLAVDTNVSCILALARCLLSIADCCYVLLLSGTGNLLSSRASLELESIVWLLVHLHKLYKKENNRVLFNLSNDFTVYKATNHQNIKLIKIEEKKMINECNWR